VNLDVIDLNVKTSNLSELDKTVRMLGASVVEGSWDGTTCKVRCFGNADAVGFAIRNNGRGEVIQ